jgi:lantibiotic modifying enzyme
MLRPTQLDAELRHTLGHPAALHTPEHARARAMEILGREVGGLSPTVDQVARELADLEVRDIPVFRARVTPERIASVLERWRSDDLDMQQMILRGALLAADMNARGERGQGRRDRVPGRVAASRGDDREALRRQLLQRAVGRLARCTVRAADGSATWLGIALGSNGWAVEPVKSDFYGGLGGIAFALAAYRHEVAHARAEPVDGLQEALDGSLTTLRAMERVRRPPGNGGFNGLGAHIWQWLLLHSLLDRSELLGAAVRHAESLAGGDVPGNGEPDLLAGDAGLIVPLIHLAAATGQERWLDVASGLGRRLEDAAIVDDMGARWRSASFEDPIGGFAHGATGIGWALARLSISAAGSAGERQRWGELADGAFRFESSLYDEGREAWRDLRIRGDDVCSDAWCHGGIGIGLAASDLYARTGRHDHLRTMRLAVACALKHGWRRDVSLCHGSLGLRELLFRSIRLDGQPDAGVLDECDRVVLSEVARFLQGTYRMAAELFVPGLMTGMSGVVLGLCRMHPECRLPSPLLMEMEATTGTVASHPAAARNAPIAVA